MANATLAYPIAIILAAALAAAIGGHRALNRYLTPPRMAAILVFAPLSAFVLLALKVPWFHTNLVLTWQTSWLNAVGLPLCLYLDNLSALFGLLITFIGALLVIYAGQYFKKDPGIHGVALAPHRGHARDFAAYRRSRRLPVARKPSIEGRGGDGRHGRRPDRQRRASIRG